MKGARQFDETTVINGTYGQVFLEGELVREATGLKADVQLQFTDVPMCGTLAKHQKVMGLDCNGSITMAKINSRMAIKISNMLREGRTPKFTIISKLADPDAAGAERVVLKNCQFSSLTLVDWSERQLGSITQPFTFTDWDYVDLIEPEA